MTISSIVLSTASKADSAVLLYFITFYPPVPEFRGYGMKLSCRKNVGRSEKDVQQKDSYVLSLFGQGKGKLTGH